jgi:hypothetical protein
MYAVVNSSDKAGSAIRSAAAKRINIFLIETPFCVINPVMENGILPTMSFFESG